jgi:hypothetical protein
MKKTLMLLKQGFESSSQKTPEFIGFCRVFKGEFTKVLKSLGCTDIVFSRGHFEVSGFFRNEQGLAYYFSIGDVRWMMAMPGTSRFNILYRTAKDYKDYTGGRNRFIDVGKVAEMDLNTEWELM